MKVDVKFNSRLSELERSLSIPLQQIGTMLAQSMRLRIERGEAAEGMFRPLGADSVETPDKGLFWVHPNRVQPPGYVIKPTTSNLRGWAGYLSYKDYVSKLNEAHRNFKDSGRLLNSLKLRVMGPGRVKVSFYGSHGKSPEFQRQAKWEAHGNSAVAFLASREERDPMLMPTRAEIQQVKELLREHFERIAQAASAQAVRTQRRRPWTPRARR